MAKGQLQDFFLAALCKERVPVSIYLMNGIKLQGEIESYDQFVVLLKSNVSQMIYKRIISTVVPARDVRLQTEQKGEAAPKPSADSKFRMLDLMSDSNVHLPVGAADSAATVALRTKRAKQRTG